MSATPPYSLPDAAPDPSTDALRYFRPEARAARPYTLVEPAGAARLHQNEGAPLPSERTAEIAAVVARTLEEERTLHCYPNLRSERLHRAYARRLGVGEGDLEITAGSSQGIALVALGCFAPGRSVAIATPSFSIYEHYARLYGCHVHPIRLDAAMAYAREEVFAPEVLAANVVIVCTPNNPTGGIFPSAWVGELCDRARGLVVVDEAYIEFAPEAASVVSEAPRRANLVVLRTLSKAWGLAGLRLGALVTNAALLPVFAALKPPYSVSFLSETVGAHVLESWDAVLGERVAHTRTEREETARALADVPGITLFESHANFVCFRHPDVARLESVLRERHNLLIRVYGSTGPLANVARASMWDPASNALFRSHAPAILRGLES